MNSYLGLNDPRWTACVQIGVHIKVLGLYDSLDEAKDVCAEHAQQREGK